MSVNLSISPKEYNNFNKEIDQLQVNTICNSALCPNRPECFIKNRTITFLAMGNRCTRACKYCAVFRGQPEPLDVNEPIKIANAVKKLQLKYVVITSVTRDDLIDGGAEHFSNIIKEIKKINNAPIEVLIPDFNFNIQSLNKIINANPNVINHNLEACKKFFKIIRPIGDYNKSLELLKYIKKMAPNIITKSGFMVGVGEDIEDIKNTLFDLKKNNVDIITIGQYLPPRKGFYKKQKIYSEEEFAYMRNMAKDFKTTFIGTNVRSSYHAEETALEVIKNGN
ncbi:lipoyl synthase [Candidatus Woesearchaeota archaeon]|nr:lipoyl synthase [Candidatus Woesearchaeota archaeon]